MNVRGARGMNARTGRAIGEIAHIEQSVRDILTTPIGSRVMRRNYGSLLPNLIDQPGTPATRLRLMAATVGAIANWEPRITVTAVTIDIGSDGRAIVGMDAVRRDGPAAGRAVTLGIPLQ